MDLESELRLDRDAAEVASFLEATGDRLVRRDTDLSGLYWVVISAMRGASAPFVARIVWTVYPDRPPSLLFATEPGGRTSDPSAWPAAAGYRAPNDVCKPFTAEGQALHAEWRSGPHAWRPEGNPFLFVVQNVYDDLRRAQGRRAA